MNMDTVERLFKFAADLMASTHGQMVLLGMAIFGILMLRGPSGRI